MSVSIDNKRKTLVIELPKSLGGKKTTRGLAQLPQHAWEAVRDSVNGYMKVLRIQTRGTAAEGLDHWKQVSDYLDGEFVRVLQVHYRMDASRSMQFMHVQRQAVIDALAAVHQQATNAPVAAASALETATAIKAPTLGELCARYVQERLKGQYSNKTKEATTVFFGKDGYLLSGTKKTPEGLARPDTSILSIERHQILGWADKLWPDVADSTRSLYMTYIGSFFGWIETTQSIKGYVNPAVGLSPKKGKAAKVSTGTYSKRWTDEELKKILSVTTDDDAGSWLIRIMAYTGLRIDEAAQLHKKDCVLKHCADGARYFAVTCDITEDDEGTKKLKSEAAKRTVYLGWPERVIDAFIAWMDSQDSELVFSGLKRDETRGYSASAGWRTKKIFELLEGEISKKERPNHAFRHAFNDRCLKARMPLRMEKRVMGHSLANDMTAGTYAEDYPDDEVFTTLRDVGVWSNLL